MTVKHTYTGPALCRCGREWVIKERTLASGTIVKNYWCKRCDELEG